MYKDEQKKVLEVKDFCKIENSKIEDLILPDDMLTAVDRIKPRNLEDYFSDTFEQGKPIVPQIESYAKSQSVDLHNGWKIELGKKQRLLCLKSNTIKNRLRFGSHY